MQSQRIPTLVQKLYIKLTIPPSHLILTPGQPVQTQTFHCQATDSAAPGVLTFAPCSRWSINHLQPLAIALCSWLLWPFQTSWSLEPDRLAGLVVRHLPREWKIPGSNPACAGIFSGSSHTSDLKTGTPVATLPGAWHYRVSTGTGRPGVSIL